MARRLVDRERAREVTHAQLVDWLITGGTLDPVVLRTELAALRGVPNHLRWGVQARWLDHDVMMAFDAFNESCRIDPLWIDRHSVDPVPRMELLRFAVGLLRN